MPTWDAGQYLQFTDQRTRPCRELAARIPSDSPRRIIDLGCGPGNSTAVLADRWPNAQVIGLDNSPEMIAAARRDQPNGHWQLGDIQSWADQNGESFDIVFSNAALQWVDDHTSLFPKLLNRVAPGGVLAIQMPGNFDAPAHRIMRDLANSPSWRDRFPKTAIREWHVLDLPDYYDALAPAAQNLDLWETEYRHILPNAEGIVQWYKGTGLRPFLDALADDRQRDEFAAACLVEYRTAYPPRPDGRIIFPFRRLFIIACKLKSPASPPRQ
jgi:trans-aconitate 2-methyltransferase